MMEVTKSLLFLSALKHGYTRCCQYRLSHLGTFALSVAAEMKSDWLQLHHGAAWEYNLADIRHDLAQPRSCQPACLHFHNSQSQSFLALLMLTMHVTADKFSNTSAVMFEPREPLAYWLHYSRVPFSSAILVACNQSCNYCIPQPAYLPPHIGITKIQLRPQ